MTEQFRIAGVEKQSMVDGPGIRYSLFLQGCKHHCKNCHNPQTWDLEGGILVDYDDVLSDILKSKFNRITISGGEPFLQPEMLAKLCKDLKENNFNIWVYTGYTYEHLPNTDALKYIDVLVDGLFVEKLKDLSLKFKGSSNQRIIDVQETLKQNKVILYNV